MTSLKAKVWGCHGMVTSRMTFSSCRRILTQRMMAASQTVVRTWNMKTRESAIKSFIIDYSFIASADDDSSLVSFVSSLKINILLHKTFHHDPQYHSCTSYSCSSCCQFCSWIQCEPNSTSRNKPKFVWWPKEFFCQRRHGNQEKRRSVKWSPI